MDPVDEIKHETRLVVPDDMAGLKDVLDSISLFPPEMLEELIHDFFHNPATEDIWFTTTENGTPVSIGYCAPEKLTSGTYNLYAIGVRADVQGRGTGKMMMAFLENYLRNQGHRILIVETSGAEAFSLTRKFYEQLKYTREAVIRDFWQEGDDKVVYWKKLTIT